MDTPTYDDTYQRAYGFARAHGHHGPGAYAYGYADAWCGRDYNAYYDRNGDPYPAAITSAYDDGWHDARDVQRAEGL